MPSRLRTPCPGFVVALTLATAPIALSGDRAVGAEYRSFWHDDSLRTQALAGITAAGSDHFAVAESIFVDLSRRVPASPIGPLFVAGTIQAQMLDQESSDRYSDFHTWLTETEKRAQGLTGHSTAVAEAEFALGAAAGYDAVYESRWGGWFTALKRAMRANRHFQAALAADSTLFDAYLGIGNYNYWKSVGTDFLNWLPFIPDRRQLGLRQMRQAIGRGTLAPAAARASLAAALLREELYNEALAQADTLAQRCPEGKAALWIMAQANFALYRWDAARDLYGEIERRILRDGPGNYYNLIECAYFRARCEHEAGHWHEALAQCHGALAYPAQPEVRDRQKDKLKELRKLQNRLKRLIATSFPADSNPGGTFDRL